jgi:hypothetical protein
MKYWSYFVAKTSLAVFFLLVVRAAIRFSWPVQRSFTGRDLFAHDLAYTLTMMLFFLFSTAVMYLVIWDQRYRCRTCLRRLRMPVAAGSWPNMFLKGQPRMEYICLYGHGTLKVPDVDLTGSKSPDWESNRDMWKELESLETGRK